MTAQQTQAILAALDRIDTKLDEVLTQSRWLVRSRATTLKDPSTKPRKSRRSRRAHK